MIQLFSKRVVLITIIIIAGGISLFIFWQIKKGAPLSINNTVQKISHGQCLSDDEYADYPRKSDNPVLTVPSASSTNISIYNRDAKKGVGGFEISNISSDYHSVELHRCGVYVITEIGFDYKRFKTLDDFAVDLWVYDYSGSRKKLLSLAGKDAQGKDFVNYEYDFRVDPAEKYLVIRRGYVGSSNYALMVKNLPGLEDAFIFPASEIEKRNPDLFDDLELKDWTRDGRYFWADTHSGANTLGFIRIDTTNWHVDLLPAPKDVLGGDAFNLERGLITVHPGNVWYGIAEVTEEEKARRRKEGIGTELYIENLFTKERHFVDKTTEPLWYFKPRWISDTELEYYMPNGEKKVYKIQ